MLDDEYKLRLNDAFDELGRKLFGSEWVGCPAGEDEGRHVEANAKCGDAYKRQQKTERQLIDFLKDKNASAIIYYRHTDANEKIPARHWEGGQDLEFWWNISSGLAGYNYPRSTGLGTGRAGELFIHKAQFTQALKTIRQKPRRKGEPKPETIAGWRRDYDEVEHFKNILNCDIATAARKAADASDRSPDAFARSHHRYQDHLKRQNGKNVGN